MFNLQDRETIMAIIDNRKQCDVVIPLYVRVGTKTYSLLEINEIQDCSPSIFRVGFGSSNSVFTRNKFPVNKLIQYSEPMFFNHYDEDKQITTQYIVFESSYVDDDSSLNKEINRYYEMLLEYTMDYADKNKKERIKRTMEELS